jgi:hypothetical protein
MNDRSPDRRWLLLGRTSLALAFTFTLAVLCANEPAARAERADSPAPMAGGAVARVLAPAEKLKLLEDELGKESEKRVKFEEEVGHRTKENGDLLASVKSLQKERAALEAKLGEAHEHENVLQKNNDRLREETERVTVSVRFALPIIAGIAIIILALIVWILLFLRQVASRVHSQKTISEIHELEGRLIHTTETLNAELKRSQALRHKLSELGASD